MKVIKVLTTVIFIVFLYSCATGDKKLWIYNRWGQLVHLATSSQVFWNGYLNGNPAAEGTYYYVLSFTDEAGEERLFKGSFSLLD